MEINSSVTNKSGQEFKVQYRDIGSASELEGRTVSGVHAFCFLGDKLVVVYSEKKRYWTPPGGGVERGETPEEAVSREVAEETNMRVVKHALLGFQDIFDVSGIVTQTRSVCIVESYGEFLSDPDEDITEIKLIDPANYKEYFDWGIIGDHLMGRALELKDGL